MLTRDELRSYKYWIGKGPIEVRESAIKAGGWQKVFPSDEDFPVWAHRVRNYFNQMPGKLKRLPGNYHPANRLPLFTMQGLPNGLQAFALTGDFYLDSDGIGWFQMSTGGTVYHYPGAVNLLKKLNAAQMPQAIIPVFKLVSPDGTGGSLEVIVHNWTTHYLPLTDLEWGESTIGSENEWTDISTRIVLDKAYEGSYNYSETVLKGLGEHEHRDVKTHEKYGGFYINPGHWTRIGDRRFPAHAHLAGR